MVKKPTETLISAKIRQAMDGDEIFFATKVAKVNRFINDKRVLVIAGCNFYLFDGDDMVKGFAVKRLDALIRSTASDEIAFIYPSSKDLRLSGIKEEVANELQGHLQDIYATKVKGHTLMIYRVPQK